MIAILGSQCDVLGERMAIGINLPVDNDSTGPVITQGYLITATNDNFVDSSGNKFVYLSYS
jgi:hypothetical protein